MMTGRRRSLVISMQVGSVVMFLMLPVAYAEFPFPVPGPDVGPPALTAPHRLGTSPQALDAREGRGRRTQSQRGDRTVEAPVLMDQDVGQTIYQGGSVPRRAGQRTFPQPEIGAEEPPFGVTPGALPDEEPEPEPFPPGPSHPLSPRVTWPSTGVPPAPRFDLRGQALRGDTPWYKQQLMPETGIPEAQTGVPTGEAPQAARTRSTPPAGAAEHTAPGAAYEGLPGHWQRIR